MRILSLISRIHQLGIVLVLRSEMYALDYSWSNKFGLLLWCKETLSTFWIIGLVIFHTEVHHIHNQIANILLWRKVHSIDVILSKHAAMYRKCHSAMESFSANDNILKRYKPLADTGLKVSIAVSNPNGRMHQKESLAWFWTMDIPRNMEGNYWISECKQFNASCWEMKWHYALI